MTDQPRRLSDLPRPQQAGILCNDKRFMAYVPARTGLDALTNYLVTPSMAAEFVRQECRVRSRRNLDQPDAARRFEALKTDFDAYTGKIPSPR